MATKDISDLQVVAAYEISKLERSMTSGSMFRWPDEILQVETKQPSKVVSAAMDRAYRRGLVECGVSLRSGWITDAGKALIDSNRKEEART